MIPGGPTPWNTLKFVVTVIVALPVQGAYDLWDTLKRKVKL